MEKSTLIQLDNLEKDFNNNGYNYSKIWELEKEEKEEILMKYIACFNKDVKKKIFVSNKKQKMIYENKCKERLNNFFIWLNKSEYNEKLKIKTIAI